MTTKSYEVIERAVQAEEYVGVESKTLENGAVVNPGDWVVTEPSGVQVAVPADKFPHEYREKKPFAPVGKMGFADVRGSFPYTKVDAFEANSLPELMVAINEFFGKHPGLLVVVPPDITYSVRPHVGPMWSAVYHFTRTMPDEEIRESQRVADKVRAEIEAEKAKEAELSAQGREAMLKAKAERAERARAELAELQDLAAMGRVHAKNCAKKKRGK